MEGRPRKFANVAELQKRIEEYQAYLKESGNPPTIAGLAYYTGISRQTIYNYNRDDEYFDIIKNFRDWVIMTYEESSIKDGKAGVIFLLKNYGYTDKQEIEMSGEINNPYAGLTEDELRSLART